MTKNVTVSAATITALEHFLETLEDVEYLREGLYFILLDYLAVNIDTGVDGKVSGVFIKDFATLLELLYCAEKKLS